MRLTLAISAAIVLLIGTASAQQRIYKPNPVAALKYGRYCQTVWDLGSHRARSLDALNDEHKAEVCSDALYALLDQKGSGLTDLYNAFGMCRDPEEVSKITEQEGMDRVFSIIPKSEWAPETVTRVIKFVLTCRGVAALTDMQGVKAAVEDVYATYVTAAQKEIADSLRRPPAVTSAPAPALAQPAPAPAQTAQAGKPLTPVEEFYARQEKLTTQSPT